MRQEQTFFPSSIRGIVHLGQRITLSAQLRSDFKPDVGHVAASLPLQIYSRLHYGMGALLVRAGIGNDASGVPVPAREMVSGLSESEVAVNGALKAAIRIIYKIDDKRLGELDRKLTAQG